MESQKCLFCVLFSLIFILAVLPAMGQAQQIELKKGVPDSEILRKD